MDRISKLPPPSAALVRLAFFKTRYDNGGLLYVFECDDWDRRFATVRRVREKFDRLDSALARSVDAIEQAACRYIRSHRQEYEYLRAKRPYDSLKDSYGDSG
jgi:hypothetical protein